MFALGVTAIGAVSACNSHADSAKAAPTAATSTAPSAAKTTPAAVGGGGDGATFCTLVKQQEAAIRGTAISQLLVSGTASGWKTYFQQAEAMNQKLAAAAPSAIRSSVDLLETEDQALQAQLVAANYDVTKINMTKLTQSLQDPKYLAAVSQMLAYIKTSCGVDLTAPPTS
jgi:hypothetical protein